MAYKEWTLSLDHIRESLNQIVLFVGEELLKNSRIEPIKGLKPVNHKTRKYGHLISPKPHPLISLWKSGYANYQEFTHRRKMMESNFGVLHYSLNVSLSKELLELADIGSNLKEMDNIPIIDENGRQLQANIKQIWGRRLRDPEDFDKAIYEIKVASSYRKAGYKVYFVKEGIKKTPDLLVEKNEEKVYVECKKKDRKTRRDQYNENIWGKIYTSTLRFMDKTKKNYAVVVKTNSDLTPNDESYLIMCIQTLIANSDHGIHKTDKFEIILKELQEWEKPVNGPFELDVKEFGVRIDEPTVILYQHADVKFSDDFKAVEHKNPRFMAFVSTLLPDRVLSILRSFDRAYKQIPKKGPGIIYIEVNTGLYKKDHNQELGRDLAIVKQRIDGKLNLTGRVNAVVLTASSYTQAEGKAYYRVEISCFKNPNPVQPLNREFLDNICKIKIR